MPEPEPDPTPPAPPAEEVIAAPEQTTLGDPTAEVSDTPTPPDAPRVAPEAAPEPTPEAEIAPEVVEQPDVAEPSELAEPAEPETAPEEATTELVTEADEPSSAPVASIRPPARPSRPEPTETAAEVDPIEAAIAEAIENTDAPEPAPPANLGPQLGDSAIAGFERQVSERWLLGAAGTAQLETVITVYFELNRDGTVINQTIDLIDFTGGDVTSAQQAFEVARRAIIRGSLENDGYDLPEESYERWRRVEAVFNAQGMSLR